MLKILVVASLSLAVSTSAHAYSGGCRTAGKIIGNGSPAASAAAVDETGTVAAGKVAPASRAIAIATVSAAKEPTRPSHCGETPTPAE